ncbi:hypothetical protein [Paraburkholderia graminis]|uniref:hypothetical protein n=1 Tax=Paraburkholderia graminis TaxID=60548 RepID=UPI002792029C|nr:hypothetical protein [Paraburkholderia graminis]MDQ0626011.1 hypothetical protein [Paraburkholderia graminis]
MDNQPQTPLNILSYILIFMLLAIVGLISVYPVGATVIMISGATMLFGGLVGFLFGIPRFLQEQGVTSLVPGGPSNTSKSSFKQNTNLEQISDWLVKILVGVGLVQFKPILEQFDTAASAVAGGLKGTAITPVFAYAMIVFFLIGGFIFGYLWSRLSLPMAFQNVDDLMKNVNEMGKKVSDLERQAAADSTALSIILKQLSGDLDAPPILQSTLDEAVKNASKAARTSIFLQAQSVRRQMRKSDPKKMELTIPIFRALISSDQEKTYHQNYGQLGYALKDKVVADWLEAESALSIAIGIRDGSAQRGWLMYEFNRAICKINRCPEFTGKVKSTAQVQQSVLADLKQLPANGHVRDIAENDPTVKNWLMLNSLTSQDF